MGSVRHSEHLLGFSANPPIRQSANQLIPISDENPTLHTPVMTWVILGLMFAAWFVVEGALQTGSAFRMAVAVCNYGMVPGELTGRAEVGVGVPLGNGLACIVDRHAINWLTPI